MITSRLYSLLFGSSVGLLAKCVGVFSQILTTAYVAPYLSREEFGLWSIFLSFLILSPCFDLGLGGPALRNQLAKLSFKASEAEAKNYYLGITILLLILYALIGGVIVMGIPSLDWKAFFHLQRVSSNLAYWMPIVCLLLCLRIPFAMNADGFYAYHETHIRALLDVLETFFLSIFAVISVKLHTHFTFLMIGYYALYTFSAVVAFVLFMRRRGWSFVFPPIKNALQTIFSHMKINIYFWVQNSIAVLLFAQLPTLIGILISAEASGTFSLIFRIFSLAIGAQFIFLNPLWTHYTQAAMQGDFKWIKKALKFSEAISFACLTLLAVIMVFYHSMIIRIWTQCELHQPILAGYIGLWTVLYGWILCHSTFLSAISRVKTLLVAEGLGLIICIMFMPSFFPQWDLKTVMLFHTCILAGILAILKYDSQRYLNRCLLEQNKTQL